MKAVRVGPNYDNLAVETVRPTRREPGTVRVEVAYGGICGSDLHYAKSRRNGQFKVTEPLTLGHELSGTIADADTTESKYVKGRRVVIHPADPAPAEGITENVHLNCKPGGSYLGSASTIPHVQGGFTSYIDVQPSQLRLIPDTLDLRRAVLAEPLAVAIHGVNQLARFRQIEGTTVAVSGAGPIGALTILALHDRGARVLVSDPKPVAQELARRIGAEIVCSPGEELNRNLANNKIDAIVEASGSTAAIGAAVRNVEVGGTVIQLGIPAGESTEIPLSVLQAREVNLIGSWRFETELDSAVSLLNRANSADNIISAEFAIDDSIQAFELAGADANAGKVIVRTGG